MIKFVPQEEKQELKEALEMFQPSVRKWFRDNFEDLTPPQRYSFKLIHENKNSLISAPTGSGKCVTPETSLLIRKEGYAKLLKAGKLAKETNGKISLGGGSLSNLQNIRSYSYQKGEAKLGKTGFYEEDYEGKLYKIKTRYGREVKLSPEHPLLVETEEGPEWKSVRDVKEGNKIGAPKKIDLPEKEIKFDVENAVTKLRERAKVVVTYEDFKELEERTREFGDFKNINKKDLRRILALIDRTMHEVAKEVGIGLTTVHKLSKFETDFKRDELYELFRKELKKIDFEKNRILVKGRFREPESFLYPEKPNFKVVHFVAFLLAEGFIGEYRKGLRIAISQKKRKGLLKKTLRYTKELFDVEFQKKNEIDYVIYDTLFSLFVSELFQIKTGKGRGAPIPDWVLNLKKDLRRKFISVFTSLEAEVREGSIRITQGSKEKIEALNYLLLSFGILPSVRRMKKRATNTNSKKREYYGVSVYGIRNLKKVLENLEIIHPKISLMEKHVEGKGSGDYVNKFRFDYKDIRALSKFYSSDKAFKKSLDNIYEVVRRTGYITERALKKLNSKLSSKKIDNEDPKIKSLKKKINKLLHQNIVWLKVLEKEEVEYKGKLVDLVVPKYRNFIGGHGALYLHNTLSAFLSIINKLFIKAKKGELEDKVYCVYISPLRSLSNDIRRNLKAPLQGIKEIAEEKGMDVPKIRASVRTGDTTSYERQKQLEKPPHILITTPETLGILLSTPKFKEKLKTTKYLITDEIHEISSSKRGVHLSLSVERLRELAGHEFTRIGLSATQSPIKKIGKFLVGYENGDLRNCNIVDVSFKKKLDLKVLCPVDDLIHASAEKTNENMYKMLDELISRHETTLIFTNTRSATERVMHNLKEKFGDKYTERFDIGAHHSSISREKRLEVERKLKNNELKVAVSSTSLALGVDIGSIDLVIQIGSPKSVTRAIQRIGRSGHRLFREAKGRIIVMNRDDLVECSVMVKHAKEHKLDKVHIPTNCLDVLSQQIVGMGINKKWGLKEAYKVIRRSFCYKDLKWDDYRSILDYLAGEYERLEDQKVYGKIWIGEDRDNPDRMVFGRRGKMTRVIYYTNIGTIPSESHVNVIKRKSNDWVGSIEEEFLQSLDKGDRFVLAGETYEYKYSRGMKAYVDKRPEAKPTVPSWFSERLPLTFDLGMGIGKFRRKMLDLFESGRSKSEILNFLLDELYIDKSAANSIYHYFREQYEYANGILPNDELLLVEKTKDQRGRRNLIFNCTYGRRTNDAMSRALAHLISERRNKNVGIIVDDNGFVLILPGRTPINVESLMEDFRDADLEELLKNAVKKTQMMKRRFRHCAARALMILRQYKGHDISVGKQQMKSHFLLAVTRKIDPNFPILKETYREIMEDAMDLKHLKKVQNMLKNNEIKLEVRGIDIPSPFNHSLVVMRQSDVVLMSDKKRRIEELHKQILKRIES